VLEIGHRTRDKNTLSIPIGITSNLTPDASYHTITDKHKKWQDSARKGTIIYSAAGEKITTIHRFWGAALGRSARMSKLS
jgi:hypothetical protein